MGVSRFARVEFDKEAIAEQKELRQKFIRIETEIENATGGHSQLLAQTYVDLQANIPAGANRHKAKALACLLNARENLKNERKEEALEDLEEAYMWSGKHIRAEQIARDAAKLAEQVKV